MIVVILFVLALLGAGWELMWKKPRPALVETLISYLVLFNVGIASLIAFICHTFFAGLTAEQIGWQSGSPFQSEVGFANLGLAVIGLLAFYFRGHFLAATVINYFIFYIGAFFVHMVSFTKGNYAPLNAGVFVWFGDLILPLFMAALLWMYYCTSCPHSCSRNK